MDPTHLLIQILQKSIVQARLSDVGTKSEGVKLPPPPKKKLALV